MDNHSTANISNVPNTTANPTNNNSTNANGGTIAVTEVAHNNNNETDEDAIRNQKLVEEFQYLLEKSQSLFSGLR
jgi:hypothetical protein